MHHCSVPVFVVMVLLKPQTLALTLSIAYTLGYLVGASTWLLYGGYFRYGARLHIGWRWSLVLVLAVIAAWMNLWKE